MNFALTIGLILLGSAVLSVALIDGSRWALIRWRRWRARGWDGGCW